ncbi:hypothetical protein EVAR_20358_1 [Eumeta japonica]|uniref:Uncharacterized protein n=1 Tax=Eumeta variegata TaxID=151549 RepID=A0A4C1VS98_EUMVA|nr:hypothetical protein EVAR_20358_1 [Eumeta japonica]
MGGQPRSVIASSFNGLPLTRGGYGANAVTPPDDYKKSVDENGNAVQNLTPLCSTLYGSNQHKKPRRKKSSKNETIIDLNLVDGYRGDKDVTELLRFIEPDAEHGRGQKLGRLAKHREDDKKRSTERRAKDKESKVKRASSLEELSRTKLEDLTDKPHAPAPAPARHKKDTASAHAPQKSERRSWGDDARDTYFYTDGDEIHATPTTTDVVSGTSAPAATTTTTVTVVSSHTTVTPPTVKEKKKGKSGSKSADSTPVSTGISASSQEPPSDATVELMDFQTVTKKRKQRKRYEENDRDANGGDLCYRKPKPASPERRRKSAPPSDKSNDSNDDMDSVHSLPADTGAERSGAAAAPSATGTPHASYADIARTRHNIPDLIESCNYYMDMDAASVSGPCPDVDDKPRRHDLPPSALPLPPAPAPVVTLPEVPRRVDDTHAYDPESYPALDCKAQRPKPKEGKASPPNKKPDKKIRALPDQPLDERSVNAHRVTPPGKPTQFDDAVENCTESGTGSGVEGGDEPGVEGADGSPPDVVADRRPPVILLDEAARPRDMDGITFGFDINEQLLNGEGEGCDLVPGVPVRSGLRYLPPRQHQHTQYHHQIVNYVGTGM